MTNEILVEKLSNLPKEPGVYFHKNLAGEIIYVGKAAVLKNRVRQYFQTSRNRDPKTEALVLEIADVDWIEVESEIEALFLEAEMIRRYLPRYNILLRDDKSNLYVRIDMKSVYPSVSYTRRPLDDGALYLGPYLNGFSVKRAMKYLRKIFPYSMHLILPNRPCLQYHIGLCPGPESGSLDSKVYKEILKRLIMYLKGERVQLVNELEREMHSAAKKKEFELAAQLRNQLFALRNLSKQVIFSDRENMDLSRDHALNDLSQLLGLKKIPRRIEGYDISHMSGVDTVASMVVFTNGVADKGAYRKFKMRILGNDDFAHMNEVLSRRLSEKHNNWPLPDLFLIDGGKGQLGAALMVLSERDIKRPAIGLAKQFEEIIVKKGWPLIEIDSKKILALNGVVMESDDFYTIKLPSNSHVVKLLQRIRDESHRFAISYHTVLKTKRQTSSLLDDIPTIGPETRKKLLRTFGSYKGIQQARQWELEKIVGEKRAIILRQYMRPHRKDEI
ncbi:excinuclease ABC subunit UvrC [Candidatus Saccharibacteria bacterium]|nr:excinuclease ABC subunit UvrC [Candidatus Saccharibacteria bacterium]